MSHVNWLELWDEFAQATDNKQLEVAEHGFGTPICYSKPNRVRVFQEPPDFIRCVSCAKRKHNFLPFRRRRPRTNHLSADATAIMNIRNAPAKRPVERGERGSSPV